MKSDLNQLMGENSIDAILVTGPAQHNPAMVYLTGGAHLTNADLIKKIGEEPVLFINPMEREEAAKTGLATRNLANYHFADLIKECNGDILQATIMRYQKMFADLEITSGKLAIFGKSDAGSSYVLFTGLQEKMPDLEIVGQFDDSILLHAMSTKDEYEVERIRHMGRITTAVVAQVADFLTSHKINNDILIKDTSQPLTIGEVKRQIDLWLAERGAENPEGTIFAIGRDAGIPHSSGNPDDHLRLGETIVFDIFPCEAGGGYYYDFTRTWCLGYASDEILSLYEDVLDVYRSIISELKVNTLCRPYQEHAAEMFRMKGHPTIEENPETEEGYVHSLGHGLGLNVHEKPVFGRIATERDRLVEGTVVTIEPGLYYPERGMGIRLEDTIWVRPDGQIEILVDYPLDLVLPLKKPNR